MVGKLVLAVAALIGVTGTAMSAAQPPVASPEGLWLNPHRSVAVRAGPCGNRLCGWIVWANAEAQSDARDSGITQLIGTALLENYQPKGPGTWRGTIYVPDMGRRFYSEIDMPSHDSLRVRGCILHGWICKSQLWTRIEAVPHG